MSPELPVEDEHIMPFAFSPEQHATFDHAQALLDAREKQLVDARKYMNLDLAFQHQTFAQAYAASVRCISLFPDNLQSTYAPFAKVDVSLVDLFTFMARTRSSIIHHDTYLSWEEDAASWAEPTVNALSLRLAKVILIKEWQPNRSYPDFNNLFWEHVYLIGHEYGHMVPPFDENFARAYGFFLMFRYYCATHYCPLSGQSYTAMQENELQYNLALRMFSKHLIGLGSSDEYQFWLQDVLPAILAYDTFEQTLAQWQRREYETYCALRSNGERHALWEICALDIDERQPPELLAGWTGSDPSPCAKN